MHVQPFLKHRFPAQPKSGEPPFLQVAGTEMGVTEPEATFSACFGGAFLMWHPMKYASMLADKMNQHGTTAWLVDTGWTGGRWADQGHTDPAAGQGPYIKAAGAGDGPCGRLRHSSCGHQGRRVQTLLICLGQRERQVEEVDIEQC